MVDPARRVVRNGATLILGRAVAIAAGVVAFPVLLRGIGAQGFGVWVFLNGLVGLLGYLDLGLGSAQIREVARALETRRHRRARSVLTIGTVWSFGFGGLAFALGTVCWPLIAAAFPRTNLSADGTVFMAIQFALWTGVVAAPWRAILEGTQAYLPLTAIDCATAILTAAISMAIVLAGGRLTALAIGSAAVTAMRTIVYIAVAHHRMPMLTPSLRLLRRSDVTAALRYSLPIQATSLAMAFNSEADRLVLAAFAGPATVAAYEPGSRVANLFRLPVLFVAVTAFPAVSRVAASGRRDRLDQIYLQMTRYLATFASVGGAGLVVCADPLIRLWLGQPVPLAAATLALMSAGCVVNLAVNAASVTTRAEGQPRPETAYAFVAATLNLLLTIPLLKLLGPWGVPLSTAIAVAVASGYFLVSFHRRSGRPTRLAVKAVVPPGMAAVMAIGFTFAVAGLLPDGPGRAGAALAVACRGGLATCLVLAVLAVLRYLDATDVARLRALLGWQRPSPATGPALEEESG